MVFKRESLAKYLEDKHLPASQTTIEMPVYSTTSVFKLDIKSGSVSLSGKMNLQDQYYNLAMIDNNFDVVMSADKPGLFTADVTALTYIKLSFEGDPNDIIYAFVE